MADTGFLGHGAALTYFLALPLKNRMKMQKIDTHSIIFKKLIKFILVVDSVLFFSIEINMKVGNFKFPNKLVICLMCCCSFCE